MLLFQRRSGQALFSSNADSHATAAGPSYANTDSTEYQREPGRNSANADSDLYGNSGSGSRDPDSHAEERRTRTQHANAESAHQDS